MDDTLSATFPASLCSTDVAEFLELLWIHGETYEVRSPECPDRRGGTFLSVHSGYFRDVERAAQEVSRLAELRPEGVYCTLNPVNPTLLARSAHRIKAKAKFTSKDKDVLRRNWLMIDVDATRPGGTSSTDAEVQAALNLAGKIRDELAADGWPDPLLCMSGNGAYLLYRIELPNDDESTDLVKRFLRGLAERFNNEFATVDLSACNASRILKVAGTYACKGTDMRNEPGEEDRPHRQSWFFPPAGKLSIVPRELLESVAVAPDAAKTTHSNGCGSATGTHPYTLDGLIKACEEASQGERSPRDFALLTFAVEQGLNKEVVWTRVQDIGKFAEGGRRYFDLTWEAAARKTSPLPVVDSSRITADPPVSGPPEDDTPTDDNVISNGFAKYVIDQATGARKRIVRPLKMSFLIDVVNESTDRWPRHANGSLFFVHNKQVRWLERTEDLFAYLHLIKPVRWHSGERFVSRAEFRSALLGKAIQYKAIEDYPHEPLVPNHFYLCDQVEQGDGSTLAAFLDFFSPKTDVDRDLLQATLMTMAWGGPGGKRPAFLFKARGRGKGKTTAAEQLAGVFGGCLSFSMNDRAREVKERLLSPESLTKRGALLDNIKTSKISSGDFEALITAQEISGKRMYVGEASRPNTLTWFLTTNGPSLSKDMAQRCIPIELDDPNFSRDWDANILAFVEANRWKIIGDLVGVLRGPSYPLRRYSRWGLWERDVLEKLPEPNEVQQVIRERQAEIDTDAEETGLVADYFQSRLEDLHYDTDTERVFIPSRIATQWLTEATHRDFNAISGGQYLNQQIDEESLRCLRRNRTHALGRGYVWHGPNAGATDTIRTDLETRLNNAFESGYGYRKGGR